MVKFWTAVLKKLRNMVVILERSLGGQKTGWEAQITEMGKQVIVAGGGASGMAAAIMAARKGSQVTILEHMDRVGKKLLSTGNGRCNLTNLKMGKECYRSDQKGFPMKVLERFGVKETLAFFEGIGVLTKDKNGYVYPNSEQAAAVLDLLRLELGRLGVKIILGCQVKRIGRNRIREGFLAETSLGDFEGAAVILASGSRAAAFTGSDGSGYELVRQLGHRVIVPLPALVQLRCEGKYFKQLAGVRCEAKVFLYSGAKRLAWDQGEVQLTDYGISGIPVFQVSRFASRALYGKQPVRAVVDFLPTMDTDSARVFLQQRRKRLGHLKCGDFLTGILHKKLAAVLLKLTGISAEQEAGMVPEDQWERLLVKIKAFDAIVTGTNSFEQAQVCCGGVDTREICPDNLESRLIPGLYIVGELLDVDGICGGYNLQWAWSTGCLAGSSAGECKMGGA